MLKQNMLKQMDNWGGLETTMKPLKQLYDELQNRKDFSIIRTGIDGGIGEFTKGKLASSGGSIV